MKMSGQQIGGGLALRTAVGRWYPREIWKAVGRREKLRYLVRAFTERRGGHCFLLYEREVFVGYAIIRETVSQRFLFSRAGDHILAPYVIFPAFRGRGLAQKLLAAALAQLGESKVWAYTTQDNAVSMAVLQKAGFVSAGPVHMDKRKRYAVLPEGGTSPNLLYVYGGKSI